MERGGTINLVGGTAITVVNYNRNSLNTSLITDLLTGVAITVAGTLLHQGILYGGNKTPGQSKAGVEYVLKPNTYYYLDVYNPTNGSLNYHYVRNWYEEEIVEDD